MSLSVYQNLTRVTLAELKLDAFTAFALLRALPFNECLQSLKLDQARARACGRTERGL